MTTSVHTNFKQKECTLLIEETIFPKAEIKESLKIIAHLFDFTSLLFLPRDRVSRTHHSKKRKSHSRPSPPSLGKQSQGEKGYEYSLLFLPQLSL